MAGKILADVVERVFTIQFEEEDNPEHWYHNAGQIAWRRLVEEGSTDNWIYWSTRTISKSLVQVTYISKAGYQHNITADSEYQYIPQ